MGRKPNELLIGCGLLVLSCLQQGLRSPAEGGHAWVRVSSDHFSLFSDLDETDADRVIAGLEETYDLLGAAVFGHAGAPAFHTDAIVFQREADLDQFIGDWGGAYRQSMPNDLEPTPTLLASGTLSPLARLLFTHELTHRFNHVALGPTPAWLNEGLADYYETIRAERGKPILGEIDPRYQCTPDGLGDLLCYEYDRLPGSALPKASEVVALDYEAFYASVKDEVGSTSFQQNLDRKRHYAVSWLLVHMLMHTALPYAQHFRMVLAGPPSPHKGEALAELVSDVPAADLNRDFTTYLKKSMPWRQHHAALPKPLTALQRRSLADADVHILWARLDSFQGKNAERARLNLNAAQQGSRGGEASFWLGRFNQVHGDAPAAERSYRLALEREPGNPDYLYGLLDLYWGGREGKAWLEAAHSERVNQTVTALARSARSAHQWSTVAAHRLLNDDVAGALSSSAEACRLDPGCWPCFHNRAAALFASGDATEAARTELVALNRLPENAPQQVVSSLARARAFYVRATLDPSSVQSQPPPGLVAP